MKLLKRPDVAFTLAVLLLTAAGAKLLNNRTCRALDEREWRWFGKQNAWQAAFDTLSATCGVGLLTSDVNEQYTPTGRWLLTGLGVGGAALYMIGILAALRRRSGAAALPGAAADRAGSEHRPPPIWPVMLAFLALLVLSVPLTAGLEYICAGSGGWVAAGAWGGSAWRAIASIASLGWLPGAPPRSCTWIYALLGLVGGLGWMVWLLPWRRFRGCCPPVRCLLAWVGSYLAFLALMAVMVLALEVPRGSRLPSENATLTGQPGAARFGRSLVQTVCAATSGQPTEVLADRNVTEGTKVALGLVMVVGPLGAAPGGGVTWLLLACAIAAGGATLAGRGRSSVADRNHCRRLSRAGAVCLALALLLTMVVAFGLLAIEARTASPNQRAPTFADAFLDAASATAGGGLSSGVVDLVISRKLSRGIQQSVDLYQYGMTWLIAAMLIGRVLPLVVLCQTAGGQPEPPRDTDSASS